MDVSAKKYGFKISLKYGIELYFKKGGAYIGMDGRFCFAGFSRKKNYSSKIPAFSLFVIFSGGRKSTPADTNFTLPSGRAMK